MAMLLKNGTLGKNTWGERVDRNSEMGLRKLTVWSEKYGEETKYRGNSKKEIRAPVRNYYPPSLTQNHSKFSPTLLFIETYKKKTNGVKEVNFCTKIHFLNYIKKQKKNNNILLIKPIL